MTSAVLRLLSTLAHSSGEVSFLREMDLAGDHAEQGPEKALGPVPVVIGQAVVDLEQLGRHEQPRLGLFALRVGHDGLFGLHAVSPGVLAAGHGRLIIAATYPAPNPLSMLTTATFELQLFSMAKSAVMPPRLTP